MLTVLSGGIGSNKSQIMTDMIKSSVLNGEDVVVIIPDQYSFEYDKELYSALGAAAFNRLSTMGFNRFAEIMMKKYGSKNGALADSYSKLVAMFLAISELKKTGAGIYEKSIKKPRFAGDMLALIDELKKSGVTYKELEAACADVNGALSDKLESISDVFESYENRLSDFGLQDETGAVAEAARLAQDHGYFKGKTVFIHEFSGFTADEYEAVRVILKDSLSLTVSLVISDGNNLTSNMSPFLTCIRTKSKLSDLAGGKVKYISADSFFFKTKALGFLESNIFCIASQSCELSGGITVAETGDPYNEIEFTAASIKKLVREKGYTYNDIAVVSRTLDSYSSVIETVFERYGIPYFEDRRSGIFNSSLVLYVMFVFDCVMTRRYRTENILKYIKSPLSDIQYWESSAIEDYCFKWGVDGDMWLSDFTAAEGENSDKFLNTINTIRKKIIDPLEEFKSSVSGKTAAEICLALNTLLGRLNLSDKTFSLIAKSVESNEADSVQTAREFKQIWNSFLSAVSTIYKRLGGEKITLRQFYDLLRLMLSQITVSSPPQKLDSVTVAKAEHSRTGSKKAVFVIGVNDGMFPMEIKQKGLLSERDRNELKSLGIEFSDDSKRAADYERLITYIAFCSASERLYVSYPICSMKNEPLRPSYLIAQLLRMFPDLKILHTSELKPSFYCENLKSTYNKYIENINKNDADTEALKLVLETDGEYRAKLKFLSDISRKREYKLDRGIAKKLFLPHDINMSATRADDFYKCPFNYFMKNGIKISEHTKVDISPMTRGSLIHFILESLMKTYDKDGNAVYNTEFETISDDEIKSRIQNYCLLYVEKNMGGAFGKTKRFEYNLNNLCRTAFCVVKNLQKELCESLFKPAAFEYDLTDRRSGESVLKIKVADGVNICMRGSIDRVDIYNAPDGERYVRIVDYKTGGKDFDLSSLYHGLNMQMLIYLSALTYTRNEFNKDGNLIPAGVLYMPAKSTSDFIDRSAAFGLTDGEIKDAILNKRDLSFKRNGLLVYNEISLEAMDKNFSGLFAPVSKNKDGSISKSGSYMDKELFDAVIAFSRDKITDMGSRLADGDIKAMPLNYSTSGSGSCQYCNYWSVCGKFNRRDAEVISPDDEEKLIKELEEKAKDGVQNAAVD